MSRWTVPKCHFPGTGFFPEKSRKFPVPRNSGLSHPPTGSSLRSIRWLTNNNKKGKNNINKCVNFLDALCRAHLISIYSPLRVKHTVGILLYTKHVITIKCSHIILSLFHRKTSSSSIYSSSIILFRYGC